MRLLIAALLATGLIAAQASPAEARETISNAHPYRVGVMSWWEIPFRRVVRQQYDFSCGSAALATLLTYQYNRPTPERAAFAKMWDQGQQETIRKSGFSMLDMKWYLGSIGYHAEGLRMGRDGLDRLRRPAIVLLDLKGFKHFVVIKGVMNGRVLVGDPMLGTKQYSEADFLKVWNGIALVIADNDAAPLFNRTADWSPWSKAPLEDGAHDIAADSYFEHLPAIYQLVPQIMIDAHVGTVPEP
ncbi:MAG TPA: C39 family peptidase [Sphingomicrobium sp.]|nr:C39 family peptidase [Sphingomicrobium sp.]